MRTMNPTSPKRRRPTGRQAGFTVIEILVVVVIIALLIGILVPAIISGRAAGERAATEQMMRGIVTALIAYDRDHDGFPPSSISGSGTSFGIANSTLAGWDGSAILCQAMVGAGNSDGANGKGWKKDGSTGLTYGPYYDPDTYELIEDGGRYYFSDFWEQKVQYYEATPNQSNVWGASNARFNSGDNADSDQIDPEGQEDESSLRAARFMLASPGPTEDTDDDIIVLGP